VTFPPNWAASPAVRHRLPGFLDGARRVRRPATPATLDRSHLFGSKVLLVCSLWLICHGAVSKRCCSRTCSAMIGKPARGDIYPQAYPQAYSQRCAQSHVRYKTHRLLCTRIRCGAGLRPQKLFCGHDRSNPAPARLDNVTKPEGCETLGVGVVRHARPGSSRTRSAHCDQGKTSCGHWL
jgi:hypothetical protein